MSAIETINQWAEAWASTVWILIIDSSFVFLFVGMIWLMVRKRASAQLGYCLFLLVLVKLVVPAQISIPGLYSYFFPESSLQETSVPFGNFFPFPLGENGTAVEEKTSTAQNTKSQLSAQPVPDISLQSILMVLWGTGVLLFLLYQSVVEWKTRFMMRNTIQLDIKLLPVSIEELQQKAGIKRRVRWVTGYWVKSPAAYGFFRPRIAVPMEMSQNYSTRQIRWILLHELAHIKRGDSIVFLFQRIVLSLFFFHPLIWWANSIIDRLREYACDDAALVESESPVQECGEGFLGVVMQNNGLPTFQYASLGMINYKTMIRRRLMRILDHKRKIHATLSFSTIILLIAVIMVTLLFGVKPAVAQIGEWIKISDTGPSSRIRAAIAYDTELKKVVLFGGFKYGDPYNLGDTWEYDGEQWNKVAASGPSPRFDKGSMVYDPKRKKVVLFGGLSYISNNWISHGDTWEWDGTDWIQVATTGPSPRSAHAMVYDSARSKVLLFGGCSSESYNDTWEWDGINWIKAASEGPTPRCRIAMTYDAIRNRTILYGGVPNDGEGVEALDDTWEWDGSEWIQVNLGGINPGNRVYHAMVFDLTLGKTVLYGGSNFAPRGDEILKTEEKYFNTWEWDGNVWTQNSIPGPGLRSSHSMVYDSNNSQIVLFGGFIGGTRTSGVTASDTWIYKVIPSGMSRSIWMNF